MKKLASTTLLLVIIQRSLQDCPEEYSLQGISAKWRKSPPAFNVESDPLCYSQDELVKRNCTDDGKWSPPASDMQPCTRVEKFLDLLSCPPGFHKISENNTDYCYEISSPSTWNSPCFTCGGASIITDLDKDDIGSLIDSLVALNESRYYWLPARRRKLFNPVAWSIPGPNWGQQVVTNDYLNFENMFWRNCLALDIDQRMLITSACSDSYPSLCFHVNNAHYPALCPDGYQAFRYKPDNGTCYGIEYSTSEEGLTFESFIDTKCKTPMNNKTDLNRFIFSKIAEVNQLADNSWCWFNTSSISEDNFNNSSRYLGIINNFGTLGVVDSSSKMLCMACEAEVLYGHTEFMFEFNSNENKIYLTIYYPSGLWKYDLDDKGVQCFSDALGFVRVVDISDLPDMYVQFLKNEGNQTIEKIVYTVDLVTDRSAQYWCEGHTFNLTLVTTDKIVVNPKGNDVQVFALTVNCYNITDDVQNVPNLDDVVITINKSLRAQKTLLMDIFELTNEYIQILLHVHVAVPIIYDDKTLNVIVTYETLKARAIEVFPSINCTFIHLASSLYCFPTTTHDYLILDWGLTPVGHISAPQQFCLQSNGLPVRRQCQGSYHIGGQWGPVDGQCDDKYVPSETTTFLYNIVIGQTPEHERDNFITKGLNFVLSDVSSIIPADIYYLSMSLKEILNMAQKNESCVDIGDIHNIAWVMDRVTNLDYSYMHLAQTLNSTNVILNSMNDLIEMIARQNVNESAETYDEKLNLVEHAYELAVKPQFVVQISYPELNNITGLAIYKRSLTDNFTEMDIKPLFANTTIDDVLAIQHLEIATWFPSNLLKSLKANHNYTIGNSVSNNLLHIIIDVFQNNVVFQELKEQDHETNSRIVGVSVPGYLSNLEYPLPIVFKNLNQSKSKKMCSFWDFQPVYSRKSLGLWKTQGCYPLQTVPSKEKYTICECYHLTHFSQLISVTANIDTDTDDKKAFETMKHTEALNVITLVGCFLSLLGTIGIWITAMVFSNWRRKPGTKVLLQLSTAISLPLIFIVVTNFDNSIFIKLDDGYEINEKKEIICIILGVILHYSILASFMWMLITAALQFVRYVRVLGVSRPSRFMFKFALIGWGLPLLPVIIVLAIDFENYIPNPSITKPMCYPKGLSFILGVLFPICVILTVNITLFVLVLHSISRNSNEKTKPVDMDHVAAQLRLSIFLFFLLGLTWIFGIFSSIQNVLWSYLFCLTATLQGFVLFVYFIVCDPVTRSMWISLVKPPFSANSSSRNSITSISS